MTKLLLIWLWIELPFPYGKSLASISKSNGGRISFGLSIRVLLNISLIMVMHGFLLMSLCVICSILDGILFPPNLGGLCAFLLSKLSILNLSKVFSFGVFCIRVFLLGIDVRIWGWLILLVLVFKSLKTFPMFFGRVLRPSKLRTKFFPFLILS